MTNLVQVAEEITYVPTDQLAGMIDNPNSRFPSFIVLSEIQRRNLEKRTYDAEVAAQNKPDTTVAQEAVAELTGLAGVPSNQPLSSPMGESPVGGGVPAPSGLGGMQMMASGGRTGYSSGRRTLAQSRQLMDMYNRADPNLLPKGTDLLALEDELLKIQSANREAIRNKYRTQRDKTTRVPLSLSNYGPISIPYREESLMKDADEEIANIIEKERMKAITEAGLGGTIEPRYSEVFADQMVDTYIPRGMSNKITTAGDSIDNLVASNIPMSFEERQAEGMVDDSAGLKLLADNAKQIKTKEEENRIKEYADRVDAIMGDRKTPDIPKMNTDLSGLEGIRELVPDFDPEKYRIDFGGLSDADKKRKTDVTLLSGLSKAVGSATNLAEFGTGVADLAQGMEAQRDEFRKEDVDIKKAQVANEMAIAELSKGNRAERFAIEKALTEAKQADSLSEIDRIIKLFEINSGYDKERLDAIISYMKDDSYRTYIESLDQRNRITQAGNVRDSIDKLQKQLTETYLDQDKVKLREEIERLKNHLTILESGVETGSVVTSFEDI